MAGKTLINGTAYEISGGKTLINGTAYRIAGGKALVNGTAYDIRLGMSLEKFFQNMEVIGATVRGSGNASTVSINIDDFLSGGESAYLAEIFHGYFVLYRVTGGSAEAEIIFHSSPETGSVIHYDDGLFYCSQNGFSNTRTKEGALLLVRFPGSETALTEILNSLTVQNYAYNVSSGDNVAVKAENAMFVVVSVGGYYSFSLWNGDDRYTYTSLKGNNSEYPSLIDYNGLGYIGATDDGEYGGTQYGTMVSFSYVE